LASAVIELMRGTGSEMKNGASEGIRTLDINLGKVALYQTELRSLPNWKAKMERTRLFGKSSFWGIPRQTKRAC
jgi:hypothetical protein